MKHLLTKVCTLTFIILLCIYTVTFGASQQTSTTDASVLVDRAEVWLNDADNRFWTAGELLQWLNDGMVDIVSRSHCLEATEDLSLTSNTLEYAVTSTYLTVKAVVFVDEKVTNGTMEANSNWTAVDGATPHQRDTTQTNNGTYSWLFTVDAADEGTQSDAFTTTDRVYFYKAYVYPDDSTNVNVYIIAGDGETELVDTDFTGLTQDAWNLVSGSFTETEAGTGAYIAFRAPTGTASGDWYIDDVTLNSGSKGLTKGNPFSVGNVQDVDEPVFWYDFAGSIGVYPTLTDVSAEKITLYLITRPTTIASGTDVTTPALYDTALTLYMVAQAWMKDLKLNKYLQTMALYDAEMARIRQDLNEFPVQVSE
jgi:hypothetical protein